MLLRILPFVLAVTGLRVAIRSGLAHPPKLSALHGYKVESQPTKNKPSESSSTELSEAGAVTNKYNVTALAEPQGDQQFIQKLAQFRQRLFPDGMQLDQQLMAADQMNSPALFGDDRAISWFPVQCSTMGLDLRVVSTLQEAKDIRSNAVYKVRDQATGKLYVLKHAGKTEDYSAEVGFLMVANHPLFVRPICIQRERRGARRPGIVLEYIAGEHSDEYAKRATTTVADLQRLSAQLLVALKYMHKIGFVHGDLKPGNVMVKKNGELVVIDFGYTAPFPNTRPNRGNPSIKAPELSGLITGVLDEALDMWAYGSVLATWYSSKYLSPIPKRYAMVHIGHHRDYSFSSVPTKYPADLRAVLYLMMSPSPPMRRFRNVKTLQMLQSMAFFNSIDWQALDKNLSALYQKRKKQWRNPLSVTPNAVLVGN
ncbi:AGC family protein kinase [Paramicrosporidium saccamoebae]|uniref:AGC family protein kinase n=1 Tax=Paramicrosporidium saccamoebae TaxID=1246581 RepID=A0A2H9TLK2_9FUNG|nr:AGC family protein kinase [Paramicrosporidium saccamoebae]